MSWFKLWTFEIVVASEIKITVTYEIEITVAYDDVKIAYFTVWISLAALSNGGYWGTSIGD